MLPNFNRDRPEPCVQLTEDVVNANRKSAHFVAPAASRNKYLSIALPLVQLDHVKRRPPTRTLQVWEGGTCAVISVQNKMHSGHHRKTLARRAVSTASNLQSPSEVMQSPSI